MSCFWLFVPIVNSQQKQLKVKIYVKGEAETTSPVRRMKDGVNVFDCDTLCVVRKLEVDVKTDIAYSAC